MRTHTVDNPHTEMILTTAPSLVLMRIHTLMEFSSEYEIYQSLIMKTDPYSLIRSLCF